MPYASLMQSLKVTLLIASRPLSTVPKLMLTVSPDGGGDNLTVATSNCGRDGSWASKGEAARMARTIDTDILIGALTARRRRWLRESEGRRRPAWNPPGRSPSYLDRQGRHETRDRVARRFHRLRVRAGDSLRERPRRS